MSATVASSTPEGAVKIDLKNEAKTLSSNFEYVLTLTGGFGWWQVWVYALIFVTSALGGPQNMAMVFYRVEPDFACRPKTLPQNDWTVAEMKRITSPLGKDEKLDACQVYDTDFSPFANVSFETALQMHGELEVDKSAVLTCDSWIFDTSEWTSTVVSEFGIVCSERALFMSLTTFIYMAGFFTSSLFSGFISDKIGRKPVLIASGLLTGVAGVIQALVSSRVGFLIMRYFLATFRYTTSLTGYVLVMEAIPVRWRAFIGVNTGYNYGFMLLPLIAYLTRNWHTLQLVMSLPYVYFILAAFLIPESPRWLMVEGKWKRAEKILRTAAKINGAQLPADVDFESISKSLSHKLDQADSKRTSFFVVFRHKRLALRAVIMFYCWFVVAMSYYGVNLHLPAYSGNIFIKVFISGAISVAASYIAWPFVQWSRRWSLIVPQLVAGISLCVVHWMPEDYHLKLICTMVGVLAINLVFRNIYPYTTELYPTTIRNTGIACSSAAGRVGSMLSGAVNSISYIGPEFKFAPMLVFGVLALIGSVSAFFLPETAGQKMPEHIEDALLVGTKEYKNMSIQWHAQMEEHRKKSVQKREDD